MLYPQTNAYRTVIELDGLWHFQIVEEPFVPQGKLKDFQLMSVPSSYNDVTVLKSLKDHVGKVCYEKTITLPRNLYEEEIHLRIGSASHQASVYVNGLLIGSHRGGFLPIDFVLPDVKEELVIQVVLDNRLDYQSLPMGEINQKNGKSTQQIHYDFYNYSGIHRSVLLYSKPKTGIDDIIITTNENIVKYQIKSSANSIVQILDSSGEIVGESQGNEGEIKISSPHYWNVGNAYLYQLKAMTSNDSYTEKFGLRDIDLRLDGLYINANKVYLKGFGKHEDFYVIGKGNNTAVNLRDFELMNWIHANSFRTSHYPYAEEIYDIADEQGFLIINEVPAVGFNFWSNATIFTEERANEATLSNHIQTVRELIERDKNHPSVVMISLSNEANTFEQGALPYYEKLVSETRKLTNLPLINVEWVDGKENQVAHLFDCIGINRYHGWYSHFGELDVIEHDLSQSILNYYEKYKKPILLSEFGADTIAGFHQLPSEPFSEEFQLDFIKVYQKVIEKFPYVIGEHIWNFADFMTKPGLNRFGGNKKGVFTRERQPKLVAHYLKDYWSK